MTDLLLIQPNALLRKLYPKAIWHADRSRKVIYTTFDDGPIPGLSEWVLDELGRYGAKASFFCVGDNVMKNPAIYSRIIEEGHLPCNHTMYHARGFMSSAAEYIREVESCAALVSNKLFRPPYGQLKPSQYRKLVGKGYSIVLWDVISYDYEKISPQKCFQNVISNTREGSIVLFHDNIKAEKNLRHTLPRFLEHFTDKGFQFRHLGEFCGKAAEA